MNAKPTRTYRVRIMDSAGFLHTHDVTAESARTARRVAFDTTNDETGNASWTYDIHATETGALYFRHQFAKA